MIACCATDIGTSRKINQDAVMVKKSPIGEREACIALVCDGVGGLSQGEYASACMCKRLERWFLYEFPQLVRREEENAVLERLYKEITLQNAVLYEYGRSEGKQLGTTVSVLIVYNGKYFAAHVGDSRIYRIAERVTQISEDQTLIASQVRAGVLSAEQGQLDQRKNVITQCVGAEKNVDVRLYHGEAMGNVSFLVCSDGFYHCISEDKMSDTFGKQTWPSAGRMGEQLAAMIQEAKQNGERDNISVAVIQQRVENERREEGMSLQIIKGDIVKMRTDAIVNAANAKLKNGGGVCGAIFQAAGAAELEEECKRIGGCDVGRAVITKGYALPADYIIHAVGPKWYGGFFHEREKLASCYRNALELAKQYRLRSIAFPLISSGIYHYPKEKALEVAKESIEAFLRENDMEVYLVLYEK